MKFPACRPRRALFLGAACVAAMWMTGSSRADELAAKLPRGRIQPSIVRLQNGQSQRFVVSVMKARLEAASVVEGVQWTVNDVPGGNAEVGTINADGVYQAPRATSSTRTIRIGAKAPGVTNPYLWATVLTGTSLPVVKMVRTWVEPLDKAQRMKDPHAVVIDREGNVLVVDEGSHRVIRYSNQGKFLGEIGLGPGREPGQFTKPRHAAVGADGRIWVSDEKTDRPRLQVFSPSGEFLSILAEKGTGPGMLLRAHGMEFDQQQRLFVVDVDNARVSIYGSKGGFVSSWGKDGLMPGMFNAAHGLYLDPNGDVFISGYYGPVQKFTPDGQFLQAFSYGEPPDGPVHFHAIGGDRWGNVYVTVRNKGDRPNEVSIIKYNNNGDMVTKWRLSKVDHEVNWVTVDQAGLIYTAFTSKTHAGVEVFESQ